MAKAKVKKLVTEINTQFYSSDYSIELLRDNSKYSSDKIDTQEKKDEQISDSCENILKKNLSSLNSDALMDEEKYTLIKLPNYSELRRNEDKGKLVYDIKKDEKEDGGKYYISTGLYCGIIDFGSGLPQLEIKTGYSEVLFKRMLNYCCGIYVDNTETSASTVDESTYSLIVQYLFMVSLRKVSSKAIPKKYVDLTGRGYNIQGNIDIEAFINHDLFSSDKMITYRYPARLEIQSIIDVLYYALKQCKISGKQKILPNLSELEQHLRELYSGTKPSKGVVNEALHDKCLYNSLYADYKMPLEYAKLIIDNNDANPGKDKDTIGRGGFLIDASFLWEMYLYNLMLLNLTDWTVNAQETIEYYKGKFFSKNNFPDFVLRNNATGKVYVLDAKFKEMQYEAKDVDNEDIQQLHSYSYYFSAVEKENFGGAALIYPSREYKPEKKDNIDDMLGIPDSGCKFGIFTIKDPRSEGYNKEETMSGNEMIFLDELKAFLGD